MIWSLKADLLHITKVLYHMFSLLRRQPYKHHSALISYISLCLGIAFYYLETIHQLFFRIYGETANHAPTTFAYHKVLNLALVLYVIVLAPVYYYYLKTRINLAYRVLLYFLIPSIISFVFWYFYKYLSYSAKSFEIGGSTYETVKYIIFISYLHGLTIILTLVSVSSDIVLNLIHFIIHLAKK